MLPSLIELLDVDKEYVGVEDEDEDVDEDVDVDVDEDVDVDVDDDGGVFDKEVDHGLVLSSVLS